MPLEVLNSISAFEQQHQGCKTWFYAVEDKKKKKRVCI